VIGRSERQFFSNTEPQTVLPAIEAALYQRGIIAQPSQTGFPMATWRGKAQQATWGIFCTVSLMVMPVQGGFYVDANVSAEFDTTGLVLGALALFFFFPLGVVLGILGYQDFTNRQAQLFYAIWSSVSIHIAQPQYAAPPAPQAG